MQKARHLSQSIEDYLKTIFDLGRDTGLVTTNQIAEQLSIAPASVTSMIKKMSGLPVPLVVYQKHHGVILTDAGEKEALRIVRKHRLLELFLVEVMGYAWDEVHKEADQIEHSISSKFVEKMAEILNYPDYDPHGDPIPDEKLKIPEDISIPLSEMEIGKIGIVRRIVHHDADVLRYVESIGIKLNKPIQLKEKNLIDGTYKIQLGDSEIVLGPLFRDKIYITYL